MEEATRLAFQSNLCRYIPGNEDELSDESVKVKLTLAFAESRGFPFVPAANITAAPD